MSDLQDRSSRLDQADAALIQLEHTHKELQAQYEQVGAQRERRCRRMGRKMATRAIPSGHTTTRRPTRPPSFRPIIMCDDSYVLDSSLCLGDTSPCPRPRHCRPS